MKHQQKLMALLLCLCMVLLTACGGQMGSDSAASGADSAQPSAEPAPPVARKDYNLVTGAYDEGAEDTRPVAVMIQNRPEAYPQWGISQAKVIVEVLSEGKNTSMMCLLDNRSEIQPIGPVAPGRDVPWQLAMPSSAILMQVGGNQYATNLLNQYRYQNLDGYHVGVTAYDFDRDRDAAGYGNEYCWYTKQELIANGMAQYGMDRHSDTAYSLFEFAQETTVPENAQPANKLRIAYANEWRTKLNYTDGVYVKFAFDGQPHVDAVNGAQLTFENCVVLCSRAGVKDDGYTRDYDLIQGTGVYMTQGVYLPIQWQKGRPDQPLRLFTMEGEPLLVNPGRTYVGVYGGFAGQELIVKNDDTHLELPPMPVKEEPADSAAGSEAQA